MKTIKEYLIPEDIAFSLANTPQITFEVTDACNLKCTYCGYGEFYADYDKRENKYLPMKKAILLLNYLENCWNSAKNVILNKNVYISFYGGEPLLNMSFIKEIVNYIENREELKNQNFTFSMTTNALLLHKYMDYLVEHNFFLLISLDGNHYNTSYRIDKKGKPAFERIVKNVDLLKNKYPDYFGQKVNFNAVLHNRNSIEDIYEFFKEKYDKTPSIGELNTAGIIPEKQEEFNRAYRNSLESLYQAEHYAEIERDMFLESATSQQAGMFLLQYNEFVYKDYNELLYGKRKADFGIPTGTCVPFSKKVYITVNGKILPCERIGHQFALGEITDMELNLDLQRIADRYNNYYSKIEAQCASCYNKKACIQCIFNLQDIDNKPICYGQMSKKDFESYKNAQLNFLSNNPEAYTRIMTEVLTK